MQAMQLEGIQDTTKLRLRSEAMMRGMQPVYGAGKFCVNVTKPESIQQLNQQHV